MIIPIGPIDDDAAETVAQVVATRPSKIHLAIDSRGGDVNASLSIYHRLRNSGAEITAHVVRRCYSAGIVALCAAGKRTASPHARFLTHQTAHTFDGRITASAIERQLPVLQEIDRNVRDIICVATGCDPVWLQREEENEDEIDVAQAFHAGLIHEVIR